MCSKQSQTPEPTHKSALNSNNQPQLPINLLYIPKLSQKCALNSKIHTHRHILKFDVLGFSFLRKHVSDMVSTKAY